MLVSAGSLLALMVLAWLLSLALHDVSIVDVVWGLGFVVVAWIGVALGSDCFRRLLVAALVSLWGLRLAGYIGRRKLRDRREGPPPAAPRPRRAARPPLPT